MDSGLYEMIFKRKSFHVYKDMGILGSGELEAILKYFMKIDALVPDIRTELRIVPVSETTMKRGEYALLLFSEKKDGYLENAGYVGEQLDLYLASMNIGVCWYGAGKLLKKQNTELEFVIMFSIAKMSEESFRKDMFKSRRKSVSEIWRGDSFPDIANIVRFAPSACNAQPWYVEAGEDILDVYLLKASAGKGIMPLMKQEYYALMDLGIFLCFLELCLTEGSVCFERSLCMDERHDSSSYRLHIAHYQLQDNKEY